MSLKEGDIAPSFSAPDQSGTIHSLEDYKGKWLLLYFYPADDTPGCTIEAQAFRDAYEQTTGLVEVVGVSKDSTESHDKFAKKYNLPFTLLADPNRMLIEAYGANGIIFGKRVSFLIDPHGVIYKIYGKIDCATHAQNVIEDVQALV